MKDKTRKIIAYIGLVFMACFMVSFITGLVAPTLLDGKINYIALAFFVLAIIPFALIYFDNKARREKEEEARAEAEYRAEKKKKRAQSGKNDAAQSQGESLSCSQESETATCLDDNDKTDE